MKGLFPKYDQEILFIPCQKRGLFSFILPLESSDDSAFYDAMGFFFLVVLRLVLDLRLSLEKEFADS